MKRRHLILALIVIIMTTLNTVFYDMYQKTKRIKDGNFLVDSTRVSSQELFDRAAFIINRTYVDSTMNHQDWSYWIKRYEGKILTDDDAEVAINTMIASLNEPYTRFMAKDDFNRLGVSIASKIYGIGVSIYNDSGNVTIYSVFPNSPAAKAGLKDGDVIVKVGKKECNGQNIDKVAEYIRGRKGTSVILVVRRGEELIENKIIREEIKIPTIDAKVDDNIGLIKIESFLSSDMRMELEQALVKTQDCKGLIIDLRGNTGGLLGNAIFLADKFIKDGDIVKIVSRDSKVAESYKANPAAKKLDKPVVILINGTSASASEIFSGAMKDYKRAVLVGETTFGKGMVQSVVPLPNKTGVNITIAKYLTPAGTDINEKGVVPHVKVSSVRNGEDVQMLVAKRELAKLSK